MNAFVPDKLRATVEAASGGQCTVLYSHQGSPSYFFILPAFRMSAIDPAYPDELHPAFIINGREVTRLFIGQYEAYALRLANRYEFLSLPGVVPTQFTRSAFTSPSPFGASVPQTMAQAGLESGVGWHLMTNAEWSAVCCWCLASSVNPRGNVVSGKDVTHRHERGVVCDPYGLTLTGSGPNSWRHNARQNGIADLVGNAWEWVPGLRTVDGEYQICRDNDAATWSGIPDDQQWYAVNKFSGALVAPGSPNTVTVDDPLDFADAPATLKAHVIVPPEIDLDGGDGVPRYAARGGDRSSGLDGSLVLLGTFGLHAARPFTARIAKY